MVYLQSVPGRWYPLPQLPPLYRRRRRPAAATHRTPDPHRAPLPAGALRRHAPTVGAQCGNSACWDLCGGPDYVYDIAQAQCRGYVRDSSLFPGIRYSTAGWALLNRSGMRALKMTMPLTKNGRYVFTGGFAGWVRCRLIHRCVLVCRRSAGVPRGRRLPPCSCCCR
jgi:hypothetical protein